MKPVLDLLKTRWSSMAPRERNLVAVASTVVILALVWWIGIAPALKTLREANVSRTELEAQLQSMRALANEAASLKGQRALSPDESVRALQSSTQQNFGTTAQLTLTDSRATIALKSASADALAQWMGQTRINARLVPAEMKLTRSVSTSVTAGATVSASVTWDGLIVLNLPQR
jgi:general secretion pathway protein M